MGGRGISGATYRRKVKVAQQLAKVNKQVEEMEDELKMEIRYDYARVIKWDIRNGYSKSVADSMKERLNNEDEDSDQYYEEYITLKNKQKRLKNELHALNNGQRAFFA